MTAPTITLNNLDTAQMFGNERGVAARRGGSVSHPDRFDWIPEQTR